MRRTKGVRSWQRQFGTAPGQSATVGQPARAEAVGAPGWMPAGTAATLPGPVLRRRRPAAERPLALCGGSWHTAGARAGRAEAQRAASPTARLRPGSGTTPRGTAGRRAGRRVRRRWAAGVLCRPAALRRRPPACGRPTRTGPSGFRARPPPAETCVRGAARLREGRAARCPWLRGFFRGWAP
ncbi:hypothetical protein DFJ74DRAFT_671689 [Hyaloraphidium curvatum]|nr:hypothetical protein DFJ74DRAFT_671689 [Hyaloraphidium curvatum]